MAEVGTLGSDGCAPSAVVLLSGGLDSATTMAVAASRGYTLNALTFLYGQRHHREVEAATRLADAMSARCHNIVELPISGLASCALTDTGAELRDIGDECHVPPDIPDTYVPSRNIIFLSAALAWAESLDADAVFIGANAVDYSGYPDCRPEFVRAFQVVADVGTRRGDEGRGIRIEAPLLEMSKADIIRRAHELGVPLELTWSCYEGGKRPCGKCDSCRLRAQGFSEAGLSDPLLATSGGAGDPPGKDNKGES